MKSIVVVIQQPSAELRHFEQRSFSKAVQCHQSLAMYLVQQHLLFSLKLFALLVCFWQSGLSNINCSLQEVMVNRMFQSCGMISLVLLLYVSVHSNCIVLCWNVIECLIFIIRNEPSFEMTFNHGGQTHIYGADDWDTIYSWMSTIHKVCSLSLSKYKYFDGIIPSIFDSMNY